MAERTQKQKPAPSRTTTTRSSTTRPPRRERREAQGRARRPARRDRRRARDQRRGLRQVLRAEGRPVAVHERCPSSRPGDDPGSSFPELLRRHRRARPDVPAATSATARRVPARHHLRRHALRRRRGHGRRPPGHRRQPDQPPGDGEGGRGRPLQRRRHRRRRRSGDGDGQALPAPARALREGRGHRAQPGGQGQPALDDGPRQPARRRCMGLAVVPIFAGYDLRRAHRPAVGLRRHRRPLRGARLRRHRLGQPARRHRRQARLPRAASTATTRVDLACRALWEAADADSATGGPDPLRGIYPIVATITADGFGRVDDDELAERYRARRRVRPSRR